mmetsp:Transcript_63153/g.124849  ORF Transcript_63153/g.124849 Transcript_63153/m.124849 type:complete len:133 (-) Transcript_63153:102-500(-)
MEHIRTIQDLIDQHRESLPTGLLVDIMKEIQHAYDRLPKSPLWKVFFVELSAPCKNKIVHMHKTLIAEQMVLCENCSWSTVLDSATIPPEAMHECIEPSNRIVHGNDGKVRIITNILPYPRRVRLIDYDDDD